MRNDAGYTAVGASDQTPRLAWVPTVCASLVAMLGATALAGWFSGVRWLTSLGAGTATIKPNTSLGFLAAGAGLWLLSGPRHGDRRCGAGRAAGWIVALIGAEALVQYVTGRDSGLDTWALAALRDSPDPHPGRMAIATATGLVAIGVSLAGLDARSCLGRVCSLAGALFTGGVGLLALTGYLYGMEALYAMAPFSSVALPTAVALVLLTIGVLCARSGDGPQYLFTKGDLGGMMLRSLLPGVVAGSLILGWLILGAARHGYYGFEFGLALFAVVNVLVFGLVIWAGAAFLSRLDARRRASSEALAESERRAREMVEALPLLVWTCRADGQCDYLSPQWVGYTGATEAEQMGDHWLDHLHADDRGRTFERWKDAVRSGSVFDLEFRIRRHDGAYRWFKTRSEPFRDTGGVIVKWFGTNTDIDEVKRAEETQARLAAIVESSDDAIIGKTLDGLVTSWNIGAEKIFGFSEAEMLGRPIRTIIPLPRQAEEAVILERIAQGESVRHFRTVRLRKDGGAVPVSVTVSPVRDSEGRVIGVSKVARDITDQIQAEDHIRRSQDELEERVRERTRELAESNEALRRGAQELAEAESIAGLGSWSRDMITREVRWSGQTARILGLPPDERPPDFEGRQKCFTPESWSRLMGAVERSAVTGEGYEIELEVVRPDGTRRWAVSRAVPQRGADGTVTRLSGTLLDVTEIRRAREELERVSLRLSLAANAASLGIWDWDVKGGSLAWDETMRHFYGWAGEVSYGVWRAGLHPDDAAEAEAASARALRGEAEFDQVFRVVTGAGRIRWLHGVATVYRDEHGAPVRMVGVNRDVTAEHEAALRLRASEALLREFVRYAPAAIAMLDRDLRYLQASERWLIDYKLGGRDIIGLCHYDVFPDLPEEWKAGHRRVLAGEIDRRDEEPFPRADGSVDWLQWEVRPWKNAEGEIGGLIMFTQVITERKRLEMDLLRQKRDLQRSNQELEQFAHLASHDLQEPLRAVSGCVQLLKSRYAASLDARAGELIRHAVEGANRMQGLIHDLLDYSRVGAGAGETSPADLGVLLTEALANLRVAITESGAVVTHGPLPTLRVRRRELVQVLQNLVGNALKYRDSQRLPRIHVDATRDGDGWAISVADNGIGIESCYFERIFVIFQRLHTRVEYPGTGIGLAICKKIVERHGGRISVTSTPGVGSVFRFTLPDIFDPS